MMLVIRARRGPWLSCICPIGVGALRLHQHRVHDRAEQAPPMVKNVLVMTDHLTRYALMVVMKDQTAKTVPKVFYECFIAGFGVPAKLLSDRGVNSTSALVEELSAAFGIQKCRTTAYHTQCNGQVERFHQMLFCMIGKLACNKKVQWEQHLLELLQAYNSTWSTVTSYSLHYLMFRRCPHLPVDDYSPMVSAFIMCPHILLYSWTWS